MGTLDDYVQASATPLLRPNEQITVRAHVRRMPTDKPTYAEWLVAATTERLLFFPAKETMTLAIEPGGWGKPFYVELRDLREVAFGPVRGITTMRAMALSPIEGRGPRMQDGAFIGRGLVMTDPTIGDLAILDYRLTVHIPSSTKGMDEQARFHGSYPEWLQQQVASRAFWGQEEYAAEQAAAVAAQARLVATQAKAEAQRQAAAHFAGHVKVYGLAVLGGVLLLVGLVLGWVAFDYMSSIERTAHEVSCLEKPLKVLKADEQWVKAGKAPPTDCPEKELQEWQESKCNSMWGLDVDPNLKLKKNVCHSCEVKDTLSADPESDRRYYGDRLHMRSGKYWGCPKPEQVAERIAGHEKALVTLRAAESEAWSFVVGRAVGAGICLLGGLVSLILGIRAIRRRPKAAPAVAQPGQGPPMPGPMPPQMPGPMPPGMPGPMPPQMPG